MELITYMFLCWILLVGKCTVLMEFKVLLHTSCLEKVLPIEWQPSVNGNFQWSPIPFQFFLYSQNVAPGWKSLSIWNMIYQYLKKKFWLTYQVMFFLTHRLLIELFNTHFSASSFFSWWKWKSSSSLYTVKKACCFLFSSNVFSWYDVLTCFVKNPCSSCG